MVCIGWNGVNSKGQQVCVDSHMTKAAGCNSAEDRVLVESALRPDYAAYVNLNMSGIQGNIYGGNETAFVASGNANKFLGSRNKISGHFGNQWQGDIQPSCPGYEAYNTAMSQVAQRNRQAAYANNAFISNQKRHAAGGGSREGFCSIYG
jgi:hypothetical protein